MLDPENSLVSELFRGNVAPARGLIARAGATGLTRAAVRALLRAPLTAQARREALYCLISVPLGLAGFLLIAFLLPTGLLISCSVLGTVIGLMLLVLNLRLARRLGSWNRRLAGRFLNAQVIPPSPFRRPSGSIILRLDARLRDGTGWRGPGFLRLKLPVITPP